MMYQTLAHFYDALVKDDEATQDWVSFVQQHSNGKDIMELACGSGEITIALAKLGYRVCASDLSSDMIDAAQQKLDSEYVTWSVQDMRFIQTNHKYDTILCLCDSFNYILKEQEIQNMFHNIYSSLRDEGTYIMDMHSSDRLDEFKDEFFEDGIVEGKGYQWSIISEGDLILQNFMFFDEQGNHTLEQHIQRVYDPACIQTMLENCGFHVEIYTDFIHKGIKKGEKYFYVCKKGGTL